MTGKYVSLRSWITTYIIKQLNHHYTCIDYCVGGLRYKLQLFMDVWLDCTVIWRYKTTLNVTIDLFNLEFKIHEYTRRYTYNGWTKLSTRLTIDLDGWTRLAWVYWTSTCFNLDCHNIMKIPLTSLDSYPFLAIHVWF